MRWLAFVLLVGDFDCRAIGGYGEPCYSDGTCREGFECWQPRRFAVPQCTFAGKEQSK